ncbi:hypothetical protein ABPG72_018715 [Tetrahymena utriculariae]
MIEYITSKKLDLISDQIKKNHINFIKEKLLSKLQKKEIYELEGEQFLKYIQQNKKDQLNIIFDDFHKYFSNLSSPQTLSLIFYFIDFNIIKVPLQLYNSRFQV